MSQTQTEAIHELQEALKPLAAQYDNIMADYPDDLEIHTLVYVRKHRLIIGDVRLAKRALEDDPPEPSNNPLRPRTNKATQNTQDI